MLNVHELTLNKFWNGALIPGNTTLCRTRQALLFLFGKKLVLWLPLHIMSAEEMESILNRFRNHGVEVKELY